MPIQGLPRKWGKSLPGIRAGGGSLPGPMRKGAWTGHLSSFHTRPQCLHSKWSCLYLAGSDEEQVIKGAIIRGSWYGL